MLLRSSARGIALARYKGLTTPRLMASSSAASGSGRRVEVLGMAAVADEPKAQAAGSPQTAGRPARKPERPPPDHFVAVQIPPEAAVLQSFADVQEALVCHDAALQGALVDACTAHLTLFVCRLHTPERLQAARDALAAAEADLQAASTGKALSVAFKGLGHFRHQVLYIDVVQDEGLAQLQSISAAVASRFQEAGLLGGDEGLDFTAHLTVAKLSALQRKGKRRRNSIKKIPQAAYEEHLEASGGSCFVKEVQLCCMQGRQNGSYYQVAGTMQL